MIKMTPEDIAKLSKEGQAAYAEMVKQNEALTKAVTGGGKFSLALGSKGGIVIHGFGRYPVTLYREQWERFEHFLRKDDGFDKISTFIMANAGALKTKADAVVAAASVSPATT